MDDGQQLGEMTDQYPDDEILEYVCLAPKFYSIMLRNRESGEIWYETKAKGWSHIQFALKNFTGFTLDCNNAEALNHESMKAQAMAKINGEQIAPIECNYPYSNFRANNKGEIYTIPLVKKAQPVVNKGVLTKKGRIVPFGWSPFRHDLNKAYYKQGQDYYGKHPDPNNFARIYDSKYEGEFV